VLVWLVMLVARNQPCNEDACRDKPDCDAQEYECRHSAHRPIELGGSRPQWATWVGTLRSRNAMVPPTILGACSEREAVSIKSCIPSFINGAVKYAGAMD
jgi:hypothetical protein